MDAFDRLNLSDHFLKAVVFGERNMVFRQALRVLPNHDHAIQVMSVALAGL
jgi:hypothetical protein